MIHLYRDDLIEIENILKEQLKAKDIKLSTSEYEFSSVSEIPEDTQPTNDFKIQSYSPYVSIDLGTVSAKVYVSENSLSELGAFTEIVNVLKRRQRKFKHYFLHSSAWFAPSIVIYSILLAAYFKDGRSLILVPLALLGILWWLTGFKTALGRYSTTEFTIQSASPSFFKRNKDQIILNTGFTIFGAILGILFTKM